MDDPYLEGMEAKFQQDVLSSFGEMGKLPHSIIDSMHDDSA